MNILKAIFLNKENRNLLAEVLPYLNNSGRRSINSSFQGYRVCDNCFIQDTTISGLGCSYSGSKWIDLYPSGYLSVNYEYYFCEKCTKEHIDSRSLIVNASRTSKKLYVDHICDLMTHKFEKIIVNHSIIEITPDDLTRVRNNLDPTDFIEKYKFYFPHTGIEDIIVGKVLPNFREFTENYLKK